MKITDHKRIPFTLDFSIKSSPVILWDFISSSSGLAQWFAERVMVTRDLYTFYWKGEQRQARIVEQVELQRIRFHWEDAPEHEYFEFRIAATEITADTILFVTDFSTPSEVKEDQLLWESEITKLKRRIGGA